tara:strand:+ start:1514 stop:3589 length:2076 start_codon:yes stop_codon:yes gene_type:complete
LSQTLDIFSLSASDFNAYLQEAAQYSEPSQIDFLRREYRKRNSLSGLLDTVGEAGLEGKNVSSMLPIAGPAGMSLLDAFKGGKLQTRFKDYVTDALGALVGGIENPGMAAKGLLTDDEMLGAAMQTAGTAMLGGGAAVNAMRPSGDGLLASNMPAMKSQSLPEPRNQAEANAKAILELRAQGRANEVTDDMMSAADPQYMFNNTPLDMSENARMARASELGFDIDAPLYHGTPEVDFNEFDPEKFAAYGDPGLRGVGVYSSDSDGIANQYAGRPRFDKTVDTGDVLKPARVSEDLLRRGVIPMFSRAQSRVNINDLPLLERAALSGKSGFDVNNALPDNDGVKKTYTSVNPSSEFVDFNPANIRSRFARFDPEFSDLSNLSAANANASVGALVLSQHARAKPALADILAQNGVDPANINAAPIQRVQAALETATQRQLIDARSANSILQGFLQPELEDFYANASKSAGAGLLGASSLDDVVKFTSEGRPIFHSGDASMAADAHKYGVEPQYGSWTTEVASGASDFEDVGGVQAFLDEMPTAAWWSEQPSWIRAKVARAAGKNVSDVNDDDIRKHGHLAIADGGKYENEVFRIGEDGLDYGEGSPVQNLAGEEMPLYSTPLYEHGDDGIGRYPFGIERNELVTRETVEPKFTLTDEALLEFMRIHNLANANPLAGLLAMQQPQQRENRGLLQ